MGHIGRGGIYVRLSRAQGAAKLGDQEAMCRRLAVAHGIDVVQVYKDDGISAYGGKDRPGWAEMLADVQAGRLDVLLAQAEDRFTRQTMEKELLALTCATAGTTWLTVNDGQVDPATADGAFFSGLRVALARMESHRKSERQTQSNAEHRARGGSSRGGLRPFGYGVYVGQKQVRRFNPATDREEPVEAEDWDKDQLHPVEANLVRRAYDDLLQGKTLSAIRTGWNAAGVVTVRGKPWDLPKVEKVLRRARNAGYVQHQGGILKDDDGQPVMGRWETIVSTDTYLAAMDILTDPTRALRKVHEAKHLCSSIARCVCGISLRVAGRNAGEVCYRCGVHDGAAHKVPGERHVSIGCQQLDEIVAQAVVAAVQLAPTSSMPDPDARALESLYVELAQVRKEASRLLDLISEEAFSAAEVGAKRLQLRSREEGLAAEIAKIGQRNARAALMAEAQSTLRSGNRVSITAAAEARVLIRERFDAMPLAQRRALVRGMVEVSVTHGRGPKRVVITHKVATGLNDDEHDHADGQEQHAEGTAPPVRQARRTSSRDRPPQPAPEA